MKKTQKVLNFSVFQLNRETLFFITPSGCYLIVKKKKTMEGRGISRSNTVCLHMERRMGMEPLSFCNFYKEQT